MLMQPTLEKLQELRFFAMSEAWEQQQKDSELRGLDFDERLGMLVDAEWLSRKNRSLERKLREAKLRLSQACLEDIDYQAARKLDKSVIRQLSTCAWVADHHNVVITGATGVGKTYLACALAQQACRHGFRALYRRASRLVDELNLARADGTYVRYLARLARVDVLVIDDWGLVRANEDERRYLAEIMDDRHGLKSTIMTSQLPISKWHDHLGDPTIADAICDRIVHNAHRLELKGPSRRKETPRKS